MKIEESIKPIKIKISNITLLDDMQPRSRTDFDAIGRYKQTIKNAGEETLPPILVGNIQEHGLVVIDGYHRFKAHEESGLRRIKARVIKCSYEEAKWLAASENISHGIPLKRADHREVFRRFVDSGRHLKSDGSRKSWREVALELGGIRSHVTLWKWMQEDYPSVEMDDLPTTEDQKGSKKVSYEVLAIKDYVRGIGKRVKESVRRNGDQDRGDILWCFWDLMDKTAETLGMSRDDLIVSIKEAGVDPPL
ncbi:ParB/RepB/Spo0J family partition protein [Roseomonas marmotae]|uniref:ParB N-terminal domain-containing protein n=1 Tax=Roseomonas marmotae TaxID=2768161 RepID=A0ABS3KK26_9PROT|nr:ParB/RepB/Spo0J family partition protein [Roseomonas marmotae]MBO1077342.1 ParB N-terminal domain-containing protein [Roseomonas marmotae]QTI82200.1 ParB N-terminal domain-containing protein [Roseomonas marmotae]